jgi:hypothetical protein
VERELPWQTVVTIGYVGRRSLHQQREADINQPTIATVLANPGVNLDALRPYKGYNSIRETDNIASTLYNAFQLTWNKRFSSGLMFGFSYTLSRSWDNGSAQRDIIPDTYYATNLWAQSDFDTRHIAVINYLYDIPLFRSQHNVAAKLLGGWQISGITQFQTGQPSSVGVNNDYAGVGQDGSMGTLTGQYWAQSGTPSMPKGFAANGNNDPNYWFYPFNSNGTSMFTAPATGTFMTQTGSRNIIHNPGFINWNMGLYKKFAINDRTGFQFRAEAFDLFNHPNLSGANFNPTSAAFGKITGKTGDCRNLQLSLRWYF